MKKRVRITGLIVRYVFLLALGLAIPLLYKLLFPITFYPSYFLLKIFYNVSASGSTILVNGLSISIINACIAASAYYLLLILNLSTEMNAKKRIYSLVFSIASLLVLNILRIFVLSALYANNYVYVDIIHKITWHFLSILFVLGIWFASVYLFKIKNIPVWIDLKNIRSNKK